MCDPFSMKLNETIYLIWGLQHDFFSNFCHTSDLQFKNLLKTTSKGKSSSYCHDQRPGFYTKKRKPMPNVTYVKRNRIENGS